MTTFIVDVDNDFETVRVEMMGEDIWLLAQDDAAQAGLQHRPVLSGEMILAIADVVMKSRLPA
ncbi:hypothetical protein [Sphingomonas sp. ID0503]|uniref:hypothetical protein n=1 Tax=Sphingomonas sp. ID0503 TaxID=3399691 RepID=UPI003AFAC3C8